MTRGQTVAAERTQAVAAERNQMEAGSSDPA